MRPKHLPTRGSSDSNSASHEPYFDTALRLHDGFNAPRSGESRSIDILTRRQLNRLKRALWPGQMEKYHWSARRGGSGF